MSIFAIGDTHLSMSTDKPMDVFGGWQDYMIKLEKNWKLIVKPEDTVVIPGDISWALNLEDTVSDFRFLESLPGTKIISKGNHDYWWGTRNKMEKFFQENGFDSIKILYNNTYVIDGFALCGTRGWFFDDESEQSEKIINRECGRLKMSIEEGKKTGRPIIVFLHYPPISRERVCDPIMQILIDEGINKCYFAHLHGKSINYAYTGEHKGIDFNLVSADSLDFCPKLLVK